MATNPNPDPRNIQMKRRCVEAVRRWFKRTTALTLTLTTIEKKANEMHVHVHVPVPGLAEDPAHLNSSPFFEQELEFQDLDLDLLEEEHLTFANHCLEVSHTY